MESATRRYVARILLLHLSSLAVVVVVVLVAGVALYYSARSEAENAGLERLTIPANQTADTLERHFSGVFETLSLAQQSRIASADLIRGGTRGTAARDLLWGQLRGRLSSLLFVDVQELAVTDFRANAFLPVEQTFDEEAGGDPTATLIAPTLYSGLASQAEAQAVFDSVASWLGEVVAERRPRVSQVVWVEDGPLQSDDEASSSSKRRPVLLVAFPIVRVAAPPLALADTPLEPEDSPAQDGRGEPPPTATQPGSVETLLLGVVPVAYLENDILLAGSQGNRVGLLLFDSEARLIAGGGEEVAGTPVSSLAPESLPSTLADYVARTVRGESDPRRRFEGQVNLGEMRFESSIAAARAVRAIGRLTGATAAAQPEDAATPMVDGPELAPGDPDAGVEGERPLPADRFWLIALLNQQAAVAPLQQTARTAVLWAIAMVLAVTAILVSSAVQLIRGRSRLERLRTEMMDKELREARQIQLMWLPDDQVHRTATRMLDIAAENVPASHISGDFYNYFDLPDGRVALVVGDVTGHGMSAAFLMATTQLLVRTTLMRLGDPGRTLEEVNNLLCTQAFHSQFVTIQLVVIGAKGRKLHVASAGHPPALARRADGSWQALEIDAQLVLGVLEGSEYPTQTIDLDGQESLLLYTDGVIEVKNAEGRRFSMEQLLEQLEARFASSPESARELAMETLSIVREFAGQEPQEDDLTLLAVQLSPALRSPRPEHTLVAPAGTAADQ